VIVLVSDMARSVSFYRDTLGIPLKFASPGWTEFATEGATLALHTAGEAGRCRPGLRVPDLHAFHRRMVEKGVQCLEEPKEVFGSWVAQYADPDDLPFSVSADGTSGGADS
jgi:predicted enzyme related to lactoylglutathione lyase